MSDHSPSAPAADTSKKHPFPCPTTYRTALLHYLDITSVPKHYVLKELADYAADEKVRVPPVVPGELRRVSCSVLCPQCVSGRRLSQEKERLYPLCVYTVQSVCEPLSRRRSRSVYTRCVCVLYSQCVSLCLAGEVGASVPAVCVYCTVSV